MIYIVGRHVINPAFTFQQCFLRAVDNWKLNGWTSVSLLFYETSCLRSSVVSKASANVPANTEVPSSLFFSQVMAPWRPRPSACSLYYCWLCSASTSECSAILLPLLLLSSSYSLPTTSPSPHFPLRRRSSFWSPTFRNFWKNFPPNARHYFLQDPGSCVPTPSLWNLAVGKDSWWTFWKRTEWSLYSSTISLLGGSCQRRLWWLFKYALYKWLHLSFRLVWKWARCRVSLCRGSQSQSFSGKHHHLSWNVGFVQWHCNNRRCIPLYLWLAVKDKCKSLSKSVFFPFFSFLSLTCNSVAFSSSSFFKKQTKNKNQAHLLLQWYSQIKSHPGKVEQAVSTKLISNRWCFILSFFFFKLISMLLFVITTADP